MSRDELLEILTLADLLLRCPLQLATASFHAWIQLRLMPFRSYDGI